MPEETKATLFGPSLTPVAPDEEAAGLDVTREKLLRPRVWLPAAAMAAAAMMVLFLRVLYARPWRAIVVRFLFL